MATAQTVLFQEGFEGTSGQYTVVNGGGTATGSNTANGTYFARGDGDNLSLDAARNNGQPTGEQGDFLFSGRRTTGTPGTPKAVVFNAVDVTGIDAVSISFLAGANSAGTYENNGSSNIDFLRLQYSLDGGSTYQNCVSFAGINNSGTVRPIARDVDGDGFGDIIGDDLDESMTRYECEGVVDVTSTNSIQVRVTARTTASSEQLFFDDVKVTEVANITAAVIDVSDCQLPTPPPPGADFQRPSPTDRCFPIIEGTNNLAVEQRYTLFFRIDGTGGAASGFQRVASRGEIKLDPGQTASNKLSFRTFSSDPDGTYQLVLLAATGSQPKSEALPGGSAIELDRVPFVKGGAAALRAAQTLTAFPNPVADAATFAFSVTEATEATLVIYDALGREVARPVDGPVDGVTEAELDATALPAGLYVARLVVDGRVETTQFSVIR